MVGGGGVRECVMYMWDTGMIQKNRALQRIRRVYRDIIQYRSACMDALLIPQCAFLCVCVCVLAVTLNCTRSLGVEGRSNFGRGKVVVFFTFPR